MADKDLKIIPYTPEKRDELKDKIRECHKNIAEIFPQWVPKFWSSEHKPDSSYKEYVKEHETVDKKMLIPGSDYYLPYKTWLYSDWSFLEKTTWQAYMDKHLSECPALWLWFLTNGNWRDHHYKNWLTKLDVKLIDEMTWLNCIPIDLDKKLFDEKHVPIPEEFFAYSKWIDIPSDKFVVRWIKRLHYLVTTNEVSKLLWLWEWITVNIFTMLAQSISFFTISGWWAHLYLVIDPKDRDQFKDITSLKYEKYMAKFAELFWWDLILDSTVLRFNSCLRLPATRHAKNKTGKWEHEWTYITVPYRITELSYSWSYNEWAPIEWFILNTWEAFDLDPIQMKYANPKFIRKLFDFIDTIENTPELKQWMTWYNNLTNQKEYKKLMGWDRNNTMQAWELEVWRAMTVDNVRFYDIINRLPGNKVRVDGRTLTSLMFENPITQKMEHTSWYKFNSMSFVPLTESIKKQLLTKDFGKDFVVQLDSWETVKTNYCWWYVNDAFSKHWRASWPLINFLYTYFKHYVLPENSHNIDIWNKVKEFMKEILPSIEPSIINDSTPAKDIIRKYWCKAEYIQTTNSFVSMIYQRFTSWGKEAQMPPWWVRLFNKKVDILYKGITSVVWQKYISDQEWSWWSTYIRNEDMIIEPEDQDTQVQYFLSHTTYDAYIRKHVEKIIPIPVYNTAKELNAFLKNHELSFMGDDDTLRHFYRIANIATDETLEDYEQYWLETKFFHQWSGIFFNKNTGNKFLVYWSEWVMGDNPSILLPVSEDSKQIINHSLKSTTLKEYMEHVRKLWDHKIYTMWMIVAWAMLAFDGNTHKLLKDWFNISPNLNIVWSKWSGKSVLLNIIACFLWLKYKDKRYLEWNATTPKPMVQAGMDWAPLIIDEMTYSNASEKNKWQGKESILRSMLNRSTVQTWWVNWMYIRQQSAPVIIAWENYFNSDSLDSRFITLSINASHRNNDKEAMHFCLEHTPYRDIMKFWFDLYGTDEWTKDVIKLKYKIEEKLKLESRQLNMLAFSAFFWISNWLCTLDEFIERSIEISKDDPSYVDLSNPHSMSLKIRWIIMPLLNRSKWSYIQWDRYDWYSDCYPTIERSQNDYFDIVTMSFHWAEDIQEVTKNVDTVNTILPWFIDKLPWNQFSIMSIPFTLLNQLKDKVQRDPDNIKLTMTYSILYKLAKLFASLTHAKWYKGISANRNTSRENDNWMILENDFLAVEEVREKVFLLTNIKI